MLLDFVKNLAGYAKLQICSKNEHFSGIQPIEIARIRQLTYLEQWQVARDERLYHICLDDQSLISFQDIAGKKSFSYMPCPLIVPSQSDFFKSQFPDLRPSHAKRYQDEYELALLTASPKNHVTPIRLDVDFNSYRCAVHPATHIHFGVDNEIRIATRRMWSPQAFFLFLIRHSYPRNWELLLERRGDLKIERWIRSDLPLLEPDYWGQGDDLQHNLS
jgi:hypothetical protein